MSLNSRQNKPQFSFPKTARLLKPSQFDKVFTETKFKVYCQGFLILARPNLENTTRLGFVFGKKNIPLAVTRNSFKRRFREFFRLNVKAFNLQGLDLVILALKQAKTTKPEYLTKALPKSWQELESLFNKQHK